jgi:hypothetical protein
MSNKDQFVDKIIESIDQLHFLHDDEKRIGTKDYRGYAYFWNLEYKHTLRDASPIERKAIHDMWLLLNLKLNGKSKTHNKVLEAIISLMRKGSVCYSKKM